MLRRGRSPLFQFGTEDAAPVSAPAHPAEQPVLSACPAVRPAFSVHSFPPIGQHYLALCGEFLSGADSGERGFRIAVGHLRRSSSRRHISRRTFRSPAGRAARSAFAMLFVGSSAWWSVTLPAVDGAPWPGHRLVHSKRPARRSCHQPSDSAASISSSSSVI